MAQQLKGFEGLDNYLGRVQGVLTPEMAKGMLRAAQLGAGELQVAVREKFKQSTGDFARSFKASFVANTGDEISTGALSAAVQAGILQRGGTIRPKTRKNLAIPLKEMAVGKWPRDFPDGELKFLISKKGNKLLARIHGTGRKGADKRIEPMFVLKESVEVEGKDYVGAAWEAGESEILDELADSGIEAFKRG